MCACVCVCVCVCVWGFNTVNNLLRFVKSKVLNLCVLSTSCLLHLFEKFTAKDVFSPWAKTPKFRISYHSGGQTLSYIFKNLSSSTLFLCMIAMSMEQLSHLNHKYILWYSSCA